MKLALFLVLALLTGCAEQVSCDGSDTQRALANKILNEYGPYRLSWIADQDYVECESSPSQCRFNQVLGRNWTGKAEKLSTTDGRELSCRDVVGFFFEDVMHIRNDVDRETYVKGSCSQYSAGRLKMSISECRTLSSQCFDLLEKRKDQRNKFKDHYSNGLGDPVMSFDNIRVRESVDSRQFCVADSTQHFPNYRFTHSILSSQVRYSVELTTKDEVYVELVR